MRKCKLYSLEYPERGRDAILAIHKTKKWDGSENAWDYATDSDDCWGVIYESEAAQRTAIIRHPMHITSHDIARIIADRLGYEAAFSANQIPIDEYSDVFPGGNTVLFDLSDEQEEIEEWSKEWKLDVKSEKSFSIVPVIATIRATCAVWLKWNDCHGYDFGGNRLHGIGAANILDESHAAIKKAANEVLSDIEKEKDHE